MIERDIEQFSADQELAERFPGWRVVQTEDLPDDCNEEIYREARLILVSGVNTDEEREWATAHGMAHVQLNHPGPVFTIEEELYADLLAGVWLDVEWDDVPMDGDPTVSMRGRG